MSAPASKPHVYFLTITILPQEKGVDVRSLIHHIRDSLQKPKQAGVRIKSAFKVIGEAKVIAIAEVLETGSFDALVDDLYRHGPINVNTQPLIYYEDFARNLQVAEELLQNTTELPVNNLYWLDTDLEYHGKTFDEFLAIWKKEALAVLTPRSKGEFFIELYKGLAKRNVQAFIHNDLPENFDKMTFDLPIIRENGANIQFKCKGIKSLNHYN
uniref:Uncharacterized protein n=1 Tax=Arion vulgaris TaxID=1028688 RepID=A0A0B7BA58_9EUPU